MSTSEGLATGLGNMDPEQRRAIYCDLRDALGISATEPMLPLPPAELAAWSRQARRGRRRAACGDLKASSIRAADLRAILPP